MSYPNQPDFSSYHGQYPQFSSSFPEPQRIQVMVPPNIYIVCEKSASDLPYSTGSNKSGTPIRAFDNVYDAEQYVTEFSIGGRHIIAVPLYRSTKQSIYPNYISESPSQLQISMSPQQMHPTSPHCIPFQVPSSVRQFQSAPGQQFQSAPGQQFPSTPGQQFTAPSSQQFSSFPPAQSFQINQQNRNQQNKNQPTQQNQQNQQNRNQLVYKKENNRSRKTQSQSQSPSELDLFDELPQYYP